MRLEDINEKVSGDGNHNEIYVVIIGNCNKQNCLPHPNGLTNSTEILNLHFWCDDPSNEIQNYI